MPVVHRQVRRGKTARWPVCISEKEKQVESDCVLPDWLRDDMVDFISQPLCGSAWPAFRRTRVRCLDRHPESCDHPDSRTW